MRSIPAGLCHPVLMWRLRFHNGSSANYGRRLAQATPSYLHAPPDNGAGLVAKSAHGRDVGGAAVAKEKGRDRPGHLTSLTYVLDRLLGRPD